MNQCASCAQKSNNLYLNGKLLVRDDNVTGEERDVTVKMLAVYCLVGLETDGALLAM